MILYFDTNLIIKANHPHFDITFDRLGLFKTGDGCLYYDLYPDRMRFYEDWPYDFEINPVLHLAAELLWGKGFEGAKWEFGSE